MLLLACLFVALPDVPALFGFFWQHKPSAPAGVWIPPVSRRGFRIATRTVELVFTIGFLVLMPVFDGMGWWQTHKAAQVKSPMLGAWKLDAVPKASGPFVSPEGEPMTALYVDTVQRAFARSTDGALWRTRLTLDDKAHTVRIRFYVGAPTLYAYAMPDGDHLVLTTKAPEAQKDAKGKADAKPAAAFTPEVLTLTRIPIPAHYPLLERGFHFVNQWGLER
jgi:hypothetical protein